MLLPDAQAPLSGIPPEAWLSGLPLGMGVQPQQSLSGDAEAGKAGPESGMTGGLSLAELQQMLGAEQFGDNPGAATQASLFAGLGDQSFSQGGYGIAGGATPNAPVQGRSGYVTAGQQQAEQDPVQIIRQALGLAGKGVGFADQVSRGSATTPGGFEDPGPQGMDVSGFSLSEEGLPASPVGTMQDSLGPGALGGLGAFADPGFGMLMTRGLLEGSIDPSWISSLEPQEKQQLLTALVTGQESDSVLDTDNFSLGVGGFRDTPIQRQGLGETNPLGATGAGIGTMLGLLNLYQGFSGDNTMAGIGGGIQAAQGVMGLLKNVPDLANAFGLDPSTLGDIGGAVGGAGSLLGLAGGAKSLSEGNIGQGVTSTLGGALQAYQTLSQLYPSLFPAIQGGATAGAAAGGAAAGEGAGAGATGGAGALTAIPMALAADSLGNINSEIYGGDAATAIQALGTVLSPFTMGFSALLPAITAGVGSMFGMRDGSFQEHRGDAMGSFNTLSGIPDLVQFARNEQDIANIIRLANQGLKRSKFSEAGLEGGYEKGAELANIFNPMFKNLLAQQRNRISSGDPSLLNQMSLDDRLVQIATPFAEGLERAGLLGRQRPGMIAPKDKSRQSLLDFIYSGVPHTAHGGFVYANNPRRFDEFLLPHTVPGNFDFDQMITQQGGLPRAFLDELRLQTLFHGAQPTQQDREVAFGWRHPNQLMSGDLNWGVG